VPAGPPLRVAMVVHSSVVPTWIAALAARLDATPEYDFGIFALPSSQERPRTPSPSLGRVYERIDATLFRCRPDALRHVRIRVQPAPVSSFDGHDVVLDFASMNPEALAEGVRYGVWSLTHESTMDATATRLYLTQIEAHFSDGRRAVVYHSYGRVDPTSPHRTRNYALWKAHGAFAQRLETVRRLGLTYVESRKRGVATRARDHPASPPSRHALRDAAAGTVGALRRRVRTVGEREAWFVATRPRRHAPPAFESGSTEGFASIGPSWEAAVADPFVIEEGGDTYVFFEEDTGAGKAHVSYVRLDVDARPATSPQRVLAAPYHLSYPFVFHHDGEIFMIPESSANRTIELYRAAPFPSTWSLERVLMTGVRAFDTTLLVHEGRMWLFATVPAEGAPPNDELNLYWSNSLFGPWEAHPANPVVSDVRSARPAGRIFERAGDLIRPAQDCSQRYGYALVFNRIDVLTDDEYRETPVGRVEPDWFPGLVATHTYNFGSDVEVIDGKRLVPRGPFARFRRSG
jgi:hypothetical protein